MNRPSEEDVSPFPTMRDYFAAFVLPAVLTTATGKQVSAEIVADGAYLIADAMMERRKKPAGFVHPQKGRPKVKRGAL